MSGIGAGETPEERRAAEVVGSASRRELRRYADEPGGDESLDYIDECDEVYEMKSVTPKEWKELRALRTRSYPSERLGMRWSVLIAMPTMEDKFRPMPEYPEDDPAEIAAIEADGVLRVKRKAEREARVARPVFRRAGACCTDREPRGEAPGGITASPRTRKDYQHSGCGASVRRGAHGPGRG